MAEQNNRTGFKDFTIIQTVTFIVLFSMILIGIIIIRNINSEYKTRKVAGEMQKYRYSILAFNNIYNGLPGDLERATFHWPEKTEDGDGNRLIGSLAKEKILAWQHLQLSNQISFESEMTGNWHQDVEGKLEPSYNIPKSSLEGASYFISNDIEEQRNIIGIANFENSEKKPSLVPNEAYIIDLTIDDGFPDTGNLRVQDNNDESSKCSYAGEYKDSEDMAECIIYLMI